LAPVHPVGQQPSYIPEHAVIGTCRQAAVQSAALPVSCSAVQGSPSSGQRVGQVLGGSQVSPAPTCLSPHCGAQSRSVAAEQPGGQQPSSDRQPVIGWWTQARVHASVEPDAKSSVHASSSSQVRGHAPAAPAVIARSQVSPASTAPSPQMTAQSLSFPGEQPAGQHWSPPVQAVMGVATQAALHAPALPLST
jgi:hypothetical protein